MNHTAIVPNPGDLGRVVDSADTSSDNGVAEVLGGVALAAAGTGGKGIRSLGRQVRRHPKASSIMLLMVVSAALGWHWNSRRSTAATEPRVALLDAA